MMNDLAATPPLTPPAPRISKCAVVQFSAVVYWYALRSPSGVALAAVPPAAWAAAALLVAAGQALNIGIFKAIGHAGVYYGFKLGHKVPWVDGFPFNVVQHPQVRRRLEGVGGWGAVASFSVVQHPQVAHRELCSSSSSSNRGWVGVGCGSSFPFNVVQHLHLRRGGGCPAPGGVGGGPQRQHITP